MCRDLCVGSGCAVVAVDYRLSPENRFPAALDDCVAAVRWLAADAAELNADPARLVVGGDSSGGNLAAAAALRLGDEGGPALAGQLLIYPVTDFPEPKTASYIENGSGYGLSAEAMETYWRHYTGDSAQACDPYASPQRAGDLTGLPPALVITAEYDVLRDEAEAYGERLLAAGVPTTVSRYDGMIHGFMLTRGEQALRALAEACTWLRRTVEETGVAAVTREGVR
jgi:acetyl esterase